MLNNKAEEPFHRSNALRIGIYTKLYTRPKPINILPKLKKLF
jgi:hypothetical protein